MVKRYVVVISEDVWEVEDLLDTLSNNGIEIDWIPN